MSQNAYRWQRGKQENESKKARPCYNSALSTLYSSHLWTYCTTFALNRLWPTNFSFSYPFSSSLASPMGRNSQILPTMAGNPCNVLILLPTPHAIPFSLFPLKASPLLWLLRDTLPMKA